MNFETLLKTSIDEYYARHLEINKGNTDLETVERDHPKEGLAYMITAAFKNRYVYLDVVNDEDPVEKRYVTYVADKRWLKREDLGEHEKDWMKKFIQLLFLSYHVLDKDPVVCFKIEWDKADDDES